MAQVPTGGNYVVDNSTGANVRADINEIYDAILTMNSGGSAPSYAKSYTFWADTTAGIMKMRNGANNAFINLFTLAGGIDVDAASNFNEDVTFTGASANIVFDKSDNAFEFADNAKATFGAANDLQIYHDGNHTRIINSTGALSIQADDININNGVNNEIMARLDANGAVELYYDHSLKLATINGGISVSGGVNTTGASSFNGDIFFGDNKKTIFGAGSDLQIYHDGSNSFIADAGTGSLVIQTNALAVKNAAGSENLLYAQENAEVQLMFDNSTKLQTTSGGINVTGNVKSDGIRLDDGDEIRVGTGDDLIIKHDSANTYISNQTGELVLNSDTIRLRKADGLEDYLKCFANGSVELYQNGTKKFETTSSGINVIGSINVNGSALATGGGKILQVIQTMKKDTFSSTSSSFVDVTGLSVTITPSATTSKILVMTFVNYAHSSENRINARVVRVVGSSEFGIGEADSAGNRVRSQFIGRHAALNGAAMSVPIKILDTPSTTSACTYKFQFSMIDGGTGQINFGQNDSDSSSHARGISTILVMEVSA